MFLNSIQFEQFVYVEFVIKYSFIEYTIEKE